MRFALRQMMLLYFVRDCERSWSWKAVMAGLSFLRIRSGSNSEVFMSWWGRLVQSSQCGQSLEQDVVVAYLVSIVMLCPVIPRDFSCCLMNAFILCRSIELYGIFFSCCLTWDRNCIRPAFVLKLEFDDLIWKTSFKVSRLRAVSSWFNKDATIHSFSDDYICPGLA